jgi:N-acetylmuramoyl-L-alanine amidase
MIRKTLYYILIALTSIYLTACAGPRKKIVIPVETPSVASVRSDAIHKVGPGETIWRISKMYDVPTAAIVAANHLSDPSAIKMGQELRIPNAAEIKPIITLYPSRKWHYIIIHHSGTEEGSALQFHRWHLNKGWDKGVG